jgi:glycosyltransferase involved in cell wall biosynthesis
MLDCFEKINQFSLVSVIIPTYNASRFIAQAVQSVLKQSYPWYEVIVVDDGSTDETKDILQKFGDRIKYLYQENRGPSAARNV